MDNHMQKELDAKFQILACPDSEKNPSLEEYGILLSGNCNKQIHPVPSSSQNSMPLFSNAQQINLEYFMIQCKLCQNLIDNSLIQKISHLESFHRGHLNELNILYQNPVTIKSPQHLYQCLTCGVYMEDSEIIKKLHFACIHIQGTQVDFGCITNNKFYCSYCSSNEVNRSHLHHSFITSSNGNQSELWNQFTQLTSLKTGNIQSSEGNDVLFHNLNLCGKKTNAHIQQQPPTYSLFKQKLLQKGKANHSMFNPYCSPQVLSNNQSHSNDSFYSDNEENSFEEYELHCAKNITPEVQAVKKENENFTSLKRPIKDDLNRIFSEAFLMQMFDYIEVIASCSYHFCKEKKGSSATLMKRLKIEYDKFKDSLPCNFSSAFFIRADVNYPQCLKLLITGARGTPYEHGLYEFDIYLPLNYPQEPPKCFFTTGGGKIRFNPNFYTDGKVCLSLLGTWSGNLFEKWDSKSSNLAQLFLSLSALVMNDKVIENEPGYASIMSSIEGIEENEGYCNIIRLGNISYAMLNMIKDPPKGFETIVKDYFQLVGKEILEDIQMWLTRAKISKARYTGLTLIHNTEWCDILIQSPNAYTTMIQKKLEEFKSLLNL